MSSQQRKWNKIRQNGHYRVSQNLHARCGDEGEDRSQENRLTDPLKKKKNRSGISTLALLAIDRVDLEVEKERKKKKKGDKDVMQMIVNSPTKFPVYWLKSKRSSGHCITKNEKKDEKLKYPFEKIPKFKKMSWWPKLKNHKQNCKRSWLLWSAFRSKISLNIYDNDESLWLIEQCSYRFKFSIQISLESKL